MGHCHTGENCTLMVDDWSDMGTLETVLFKSGSDVQREETSEATSSQVSTVRVLIGLALAHYMWSKTLRKFNQISSEQRDYIFSMKICAACERERERNKIRNNWNPLFWTENQRIQNIWGWLTTRSIYKCIIYKQEWDTWNLLSQIGQK